jgi:hypothetical protein
MPRLTDIKGAAELLTSTAQWFIEHNKNRYYTESSIDKTTKSLESELQELLEILGASKAFGTPAALVSIKIDLTRYFIEIQINASFGGGFHSIAVTTSF